DVDHPRTDAFDRHFDAECACLVSQFDKTGRQKDGRLNRGPGKCGQLDDDGAVGTGFAFFDEFTQIGEPFNEEIVGDFGDFGGHDALIMRI
ncbi:MAG: hypothetical protein EBX92_09115, partial [Actinobacteria bacterium]|nr:hypothetical protein [Actinomycetota bacterium]